MAAGCGANCAKLFILFINFIFLVIGIVLMALGVILLVDTKALHSQFILPTGLSSDLIVGAAIVILVVGFVVFFVTIVGFCATIKEHAGCLTLYSTILILLLILQVVAVILAGAFYDQILSTVDTEMTKMLEVQYGQPNQNDSTVFIDSMQNDLHCCGVTIDGPLDWKKSAWHNQTKLTVPDSCCTKTDGHLTDRKLCLSKAYVPGALDRSNYVYTDGCDSKLDQIIRHNVKIVIGVVIGVVVVQVVFIIVTCLLKSSIIRGYEYI